MPLLIQFKGFLDAVHPLTFYFLVLTISGWLVWLSRKLLPAPWAWLSAKDSELAEIIMTFPSTAIGALIGLGAAAGPDDYKTLFFATLAGFGTNVGHHVLKFLPFIPYQGALGRGLLALFLKSRTTTTIVLIVMTVSCTPAERAKFKNAIEVANDILSVARVLCLSAAQQRVGIDPQQALQKFCETRSQLAPWIELAKDAQTEGANRTGMTRPGKSAE